MQLLRYSPNRHNASPRCFVSKHFWRRFAQKVDKRQTAFDRQQETSGRRQAAELGAGGIGPEVGAGSRRQAAELGAGGIGPEVGAGSRRQTSQLRRRRHRA